MFMKFFFFREMGEDKLKYKMIFDSGKWCEESKQGFLIGFLMDKMDRFIEELSCDS